MSVRRDLPVSTMVWQAHTTAWMMTAVCKATFTLQDGELALAEAHEGLYESDRHWDGDGQRSLIAARDLAPMKHASDVVLVGHAFAPDAGVARTVIARLAVGTIDKSLEAHVERVVGQDGVVCEGAPFSRMRLVYERAAGGPGTWNPVGVHPGTVDAYGRAVLPNLTPPGRGGPGYAVEPIGFGPMAPSWPLRSERAGVHTPLFQSARWAEHPLPADLDASCFNVAPLDQRLPSIPEDAAIVLENLHPRLPVLRARLPGRRPRMFCERRGARAELELRTDTLWFDTERGICTLSWRGQIPLEHAGELLAVHVEWDALGAPAPTRSQEPVRQGGLPFAAMATHAPAVANPSPHVALPFGQTQRPVLVPTPPTIVERSSSPDARPASTQGRYEGDLLQLLWFDPESAGRMQRQKDWKKIVSALTDTDVDPHVDQDFDLDRRKVFEVLSRGNPGLDDSVQDGLVAGIRHGSFDGRIILVEGELRFDFDELETVKAHIAAAIPFAPEPGALKTAVDDVTSFLATPQLVPSAEVLEGMTKRIHKAYIDAPRSLGAEYLEEQTERALLDRRAFRKRDVFGAMHTRALLFFPETENGFPTYLAASLVEKLPSFRRLPVRMLVEAHFRADQYEVHACALRAVAVARVIVPRRAA